MHPVANPELLAAVPEKWSFWTPMPSDIGDEGFGNFRVGLDFRGTGAKAARSYLAAHLRVFDFINSKANNIEEFDDLASFFEDVPDDDDELLEGVDNGTSEFIATNDCDLGSLELGVGAVAYALSAAKMFPAASCRSHLGHRSSAPYPIVHVAASKQRAELLEKLVTESGCGFGQDPARPDLLVVAGPSIPPMLLLAGRIVGNLSEFRSRASRKNAPRKPAGPYSQLQLF